MAAFLAVSTFLALCKLGKEPWHGQTFICNQALARADVYRLAFDDLRISLGAYSNNSLSERRKSRRPVNISREFSPRVTNARKKKIEIIIIRERVAD